LGRCTAVTRARTRSAAALWRRPAGLHRGRGAGAGRRERPLGSFAGFLRRVVALGAASLTRQLAGTFTPTPELYAAAARGGELKRRDRAAGPRRRGAAPGRHGQRPRADLRAAGVDQHRRARSDRKLRQRYLAPACWTPCVRRPRTSHCPPRDPRTASWQRRWQRP
jgi:hypothetical protein